MGGLGQLSLRHAHSRSGTRLPASRFTWPVLVGPIVATPQTIANQVSPR
jgi:hypothetical protein